LTSALDSFAFGQKLIPPAPISFPQFENLYYYYYYYYSNGRYIDYLSLTYATNKNKILKSHWLGRYARVVDHLAAKDVAQCAPLGGGYILYPIIIIIIIIIAVGI